MAIADACHMIRTRMYDCIPFQKHVCLYQIAIHRHRDDTDAAVSLTCVGACVASVSQIAQLVRMRVSLLARQHRNGNANLTSSLLPTGMHAARQLRKQRKHELWHDSGDCKEHCLRMSWHCTLMRKVGLHLRSSEVARSEGGLT